MSTISKPADEDATKIILEDSSPVKGANDSAVPNNACTVEGCTNSFWENDTHEECILHRDCISLSSLYWNPATCLTCFELCIDEDDTSFADKMKTLITEWRRINDTDSKISLTDPCSTNDYVTPFLLDPISSKDISKKRERSVSFTQSDSEPDDNTPSLKRKRMHKFPRKSPEHIDKPMSAKEMQSMFSSFGESIKGEVANNPTEQNELKERAGESSSDPDFIYEVGANSTKVRSKLRLKKAWSSVKAILAKISPNTVEKEEDNENMKCELFPDEKSLKLLVTALEIERENIVQSEKWPSQYVHHPPPLNTKQISLTNTAYPELSEFLNGPRISCEIGKHIYFADAKKENMRLPTSERFWDRFLRYCLRDAITLHELCKILGSYFSLAADIEQSKSELVQFADLLKALASNLIHSVSSSLGQVRYRFRRKFSDTTKSGLKYSLLNSSLIARTLFPVDALNEVGKKLGNSKMKFNFPKRGNLRARGRGSKFRGRGRRPYRGSYIDSVPTHQESHISQEYQSYPYEDPTRYQWSNRRQSGRSNRGRYINRGGAASSGRSDTYIQKRLSY